MYAPQDPAADGDGAAVEEGAHAAVAPTMAMSPAAQMLGRTVPPVVVTIVAHGRDTQKPPVVVDRGLP
ncbi:hypothetical protein [Cellulomonas rhizosphaerae]|uniref:Uncharacterized protein n=1 Tax=Cellulomonas rhizosphaerae TaxID=2293719 RepID=A0A413RN32_9CELL|nr:hypothetical protein [Cellulomonas rhizosphaerae]RHA42664.1 hypothetical protein D1825_07000 [Cellulomonas rhizosphaerae]